MNIYDLISRAQKLRQETKLDSVSPDRVGALCEDTLKYINEFQLLASSPSLHKIYASVSAMQADKSPKSDLTGKALKPGQLVVIVPANQSDATAGDVYRYDGPSGNTSAWTFVSKIGAVPADAELNATSANPVQNKVVTEKLTELESEVKDSYGDYVENPEYLQVTTDSDGKILGGRTRDGGAFEKVGFSTPKVSIDGHDIKNIENPEYLQVTTDSDGKILEGTKRDGAKVIGEDLEVGGDAKIIGNMEVSGVSYTVVENSEYLVAWVDAEDKVLFGIKTDGKSYVGDADFFNIIEEIKAFLANLKDKDIDFDVLSSITATGNPEYLQVTTDSDGKIFGGRTRDGGAFEKVGFSTPKVSIDGHDMKNIEDPEGRREITTDKDGRILSYRKEDGVKVENAGFETPVVKTDMVIASTIKQLGIPDQTNEEFVYLEKPKFGEFRFYGELPTDTSDARTPKELDVVFKVDEQVKLSAKCTLALQGHGTLGEPKANFTIDFMNKDGEELVVKFGDMIAVDSYQLKSCWGDLTFARRLAGGALYREMMAALPYPYCKINNIPIDLAPRQNVDCYSIADAKYSEYGFPFVFYLNDEFHGVYCIKLKKTRQNYAMQKNIKTQIFLDVINNRTFLTQPFDYTHWDLKNPKLKNYEEGKEIKDTEVLASINRLFGFLNNIPGQQANYADYIVLPHWLTTIIFNEVIGNPDFIAGDDELSNNLELLTWDNTHWSLLPYDFDLSLGNGFSDVYIEQKGILNNGTIPTQLTTLFETETKQIYTMLRNYGILTVENIVKHYKDFTSFIPRELIDADYKKWGDKFEIAFNKTTGSYSQIYSYINSRITFLDTIWLNQN